jgi:hypothetical protein
MLMAYHRSALQPLVHLLIARWTAAIESWP